MSNCCRRNYYDNMENNKMINNMSYNNQFADTCSGCNKCTYNLQSVFPNNYLYGYAYTPVQTLSEIFTPQVGLKQGTIFPELVSPYCPGQSMDFINSLRNGGCKNE